MDSGCRSSFTFFYFGFLLSFGSLSSLHKIRDVNLQACIVAHIKCHDARPIYKYWVISSSNLSLFDCPHEFLHKPQKNQHLFDFMFKFSSYFWLFVALNVTYAYQNKSRLHYWPIVLFLTQTIFITYVSRNLCGANATSYTNKNPFGHDSCCFDGQEVKIECIIGFIAAMAAVPVCAAPFSRKMIFTFSLLVVAIYFRFGYGTFPHLCRFFFFILILLILIRMGSPDLPLRRTLPHFISHLKISRVQ